MKTKIESFHAPTAFVPKRDESHSHLIPIQNGNKVLFKKHLNGTPPQKHTPTRHAHSSINKKNVVQLWKKSVFSVNVTIYSELYEYLSMHFQALLQGFYPKDQPLKKRFLPVLRLKQYRQHIHFGRKKKPLPTVASVQRHFFRQKKVQRHNENW